MTESDMPQVDAAPLPEDGYAGTAMPHVQPGDRMRLLESVVVNAGDAILITEAEPLHPPGPRILYANAAFTRMTGYTSDEVAGRTPRFLQGPDTDRATLDRIRAGLERLETIECELLNYRKDGGTFWVEMSIVLVWDEQGRPTHWVSIQRDVTARKRAEEAILRGRLAEAQNKDLAAEIEERRRVEAQLLYTAFHDDLTGLRNRAFLMDRLRSVLDQARSRPPFRFALLFVDLDRFKTVNDSLGHRVGDDLLRIVAKRLSGCVRPQDVLARVGGDEFAILLDDADLTIAEEVARRVVETLQTPVHLNSFDLYSPCSIGIVVAPGRYELAEDLLRDADIAMYRAKRAGGRGHAVFTAPMHASALAALELQAELQGALQAGELCVHFQPLQRRTTRRIAGFEALVRWQHPRRGLLLPATFIPVAEEIGLIGEIGRWVLRQACEQMRDWTRTYPGHALRLSVNVSGIELMDAMFVKRLQHTLNETGIAPGSLELEITESVLLNHSETLVLTLERIRGMGVRLALDDFGTGYSSLSYLNDYPLDTIKIDRSFVSTIPEQARAVAIVETIVRLGHALGLEVVAEGVETTAQLDALTALGCDTVQGYLIARPMPAAQAEMLLKNDGGDHV